MDAAGPAGRPEAGRGRLAACVDLAALIGVGWDPDTKVFTPDPAHRVCAVPGCGSEAWSRDGLCGGCASRLACVPGQPIEAFLAAGISQRGRPGQRLCAVCCQPGASRPAAANSLCRSCDRLRATRQQTVAGFVVGDDVFAPALPRLTIGTCVVACCQRLVARRVHGLCDAHDQAWRRAGRPELRGFARTSSPRRGDRQGRVVLRGLPDQVVLELLLGVQASLAEGRRVMPTDLRAVVDHLRELDAVTVSDVDTAASPLVVGRFLRFTADRVRLACAQVPNEYAKDVWDLRLWGWRGRMSFIGGDALHRNGRTPAPAISQPWLKETAKSWAADTLTSTAPATVRTVLAAVGLFSQHLTRRSDHGAAPGALDRADMEAFLARLGRLQAAGTLSSYSREQVMGSLTRFLRDARAMGLARPGGPLAGLPDQVALRRRDRSPRYHHKEQDVGRALPEWVLNALLDPENLAALQALSGPSWRAAVDLLAGVGRRPSELCGLRFDCLDYDEHTGADGVVRRSPVLVHDMPKVGKVGFRLPIQGREAAIITAQQARVRSAYPHQRVDQLALFPRALKNPDGTKPITASGLALAVRGWVDGLAHLDAQEPGADAQVLREQVGQVAVPFGICTEASNVAAGGHSCPFRHRCTGCEYFRTDPSYTPELAAYLGQLLADRERLGAAVPALAEWARRDAAPSQEEIDAVRRLLRSNDETLAALDDDDRAAVEKAIATIRTQRANLDATFPVELRALTRQREPVFFPTIERAVRHQGDHG